MENSIELVKKEVKRLIKENEAYLDDGLNDYSLAQKTGAYSVLNALLHFIDNLR